MKKHLFAGLVILLPLILTLFILLFLFNLFTSPFVNLATALLSYFPNAYNFLENHNLLEFFSKILVLIFLFFFIFFLGVIARWFFFNSLLNFANRLLCKIPLIKSIYKTSKDIIFALFSTNKDKKAFERSILVPFPSKKSYCVGFVSGEVPKACQDKIEVPLVPVFVPTAPHPISGYFMLIEKDNTQEIDMTKEEAVKLTVSCGVITPERPEQVDAT